MITEMNFNFFINKNIEETESETNVKVCLQISNNTQNMTQLNCGNVAKS